MQFLSDKISEHIGFKDIWDEIKPVSTLGMIEKKKSTPFLKDQAKNLKKELDSLELMCQKIENEVDNVKKIKALLKEIKDIRGTINRSRQKKTVLDDIELYEVKNNLIIINKIKEKIKSLQLNDLFTENLEDFPRLLKTLSIGQGDSESFYLADEYDNELASIRKKRKKLEIELLQCKRKYTGEIETDAKRLFSIEDEITVSKNDSNLIDKLKKSKKVVLIRENFTTITFKLLESQNVARIKENINEGKKKEKIRKNIVRKNLSNEIAKFSQKIIDTMKKIGYLDFIIAKADFSLKINGVKAEITDEKIIQIEKGRHLIIEYELKKKGMKFTEITIELKNGSTLITGPNMGGKTVSLKMTALLVAMAQHALLVPAKSMKFNLRNFIYFSLTADSFESGLSNFGTEIYSLKEVFFQADELGLILIDEIAHGTNPKEGYAIAFAIIKKLDEMDSITIITSHYEYLARNLDLIHYQVRGLDDDLLDKYKDAIKEEGIELLNQCMDYRLEKVSAGGNIPHDAIKIAKILGFDNEILRYAESIMAIDLESTGGDKYNDQKNVKFR